jgi:hypothetical protein
VLPAYGEPLKALALLCLSLSGCAALERIAPPLFERIAPPLFEATEKVIEHELDRSADDARKQQLADALTALLECRAHLAAAEQAAARATEAAVAAEARAEAAALVHEADERERAKASRLRLAAALGVLRLLPRAEAK